MAESVRFSPWSVVTVSRTWFQKMRMICCARTHPLDEHDNSSGRRRRMNRCGRFSAASRRSSYGAAGYHDLLVASPSSIAAVRRGFCRRHRRIVPARAVLGRNFFPQVDGVSCACNVRAPVGMRIEEEGGEGEETVAAALGPGGEAIREGHSAGRRWRRR